MNINEKTPTLFYDCNALLKVRKNDYPTLFEYAKDVQSSLSIFNELTGAYSTASNRWAILTIALSLRERNRKLDLIAFATRAISSASARAFRVRADIAFGLVVCPLAVIGGTSQSHEPLATLLLSSPSFIAELIVPPPPCDFSKFIAETPKLNVLAE